MWRFTGQRFQIVMVDAWVAVFVLPAVYFSWWTLYLAIVGIVVFGGLSWIGISPLTAYRFGRAFLAGPVRPPTRAHRRRRLA